MLIQRDASEQWRLEKRERWKGSGVESARVGTRWRRHHLKWFFCKAKEGSVERRTNTV